MYNVPPSHMWHSTQYNYKGYTKEEIRNIQEADNKSFELIKPVLTKRQIKKRDRFVRYADKFMFLRKWVNDDIYLTNEQMKELLGERYEVV